MNLSQIVLFDWLHQFYSYLTTFSILQVLDIQALPKEGFYNPERQDNADRVFARQGDIHKESSGSRWPVYSHS